MSPLGEHGASVSTNLAGRRSSLRGGCKTRNIDAASVNVVVRRRPYRG